MNIAYNENGNVVVSVSERNLRSLLGRMESHGCAAKWRRTESGHYLTIIAEPDHLHYAERPDALERYGIGPEATGVVSTPSTAASPEPWGEPMAMADACCDPACEACQ